MPNFLALQPQKIVITRFFPVLHFKLLRKIHGTHDQFFGMHASINDKKLITSLANPLLLKPPINFMGEKNRKKLKLGENTGNFISVGM